MPTLLEYLGIPHPEAEDLPGRSFAGLLRGESTGDEGAVVVFDEYGYTRMIRTPEAKYVHRYPDGPHEFYDLAEDPGEQVNLYDDRSRRSHVAELRSRLQDWFARYVVPERDGADLGVDGWGQLGTCEEARRGEKVFADEFPHEWWREPRSEWTIEKPDDTKGAEPDG
jgi:arylsulfatase A-like enzyme